ncbi:unnamed protein product [Discosporangium mesarthrocarpum]
MAPTSTQRNCPLSFVDRLTIVWFVLDGLTHLGMEAGYVWLALTTTAMKANSFNAYVWREYGRADSRWAVRDPMVISIELPTVFVCGPLSLVIVWAILARKPFRHVLQAVVCTMELYGCWMTFAPEWLSGSSSLDLDNKVFLWVYLTFMNGLWVYVPTILLWESVVQLTHACDVAKTEGIDQLRRGSTADGSAKNGWELGPGMRMGLPGMLWWHSVAGLIALYCILVPGVLLLYADPPAPEL